MLAMVEADAGRRALAVDLLRQALAIGRETGMAYWGPILLGWLARHTDDAKERAAALAEGEALLRAGGVVSHNYLMFYPAAIETALTTVTGMRGAVCRRARGLHPPRAAAPDGPVQSPAGARSPTGARGDGMRPPSGTSGRARGSPAHRPARRLAGDRGRARRPGRPRRQRTLNPTIGLVALPEGPTI